MTTLDMFGCCVDILVFKYNCSKNKKDIKNQVLYLFHFLKKMFKAKLSKRLSFSLALQ